MITCCGGKIRAKSVDLLLPSPYRVNEKVNIKKPLLQTDSIKIKRNYFMIMH